MMFEPSLIKSLSFSPCTSAFFIISPFNHVLFENIVMLHYCVQFTIILWSLIYMPNFSYFLVLINTSDQTSIVILNDGQKLKNIWHFFLFYSPYFDSCINLFSYPICIHSLLHFNFSRWWENECNLVFLQIFFFLKELHLVKKCYLLLGQVQCNILL